MPVLTLGSLHVTRPQSLELVFGSREKAGAKLAGGELEVPGCQARGPSQGRPSRSHPPLPGFRCGDPPDETSKIVPELRTRSSLGLLLSVCGDPAFGVRRDGPNEGLVRRPARDGVRNLVTEGCY